MFVSSKNEICFLVLWKFYNQTCWPSRSHSASDREGAKIKLAISHTGVLVFQVGVQGALLTCPRLLPGTLGNFPGCL